MRLPHRLFDRTLGVYAVVSMLCWAIGTSVMFLLYNFQLGGYWVSAACNYLIGGTLGYFLHRKYTFHNHDDRRLVLAKYIVHMVVCYFVSYSLAPVLVKRAEEHLGRHAAGNVSLAAGAVLFAVFNYFGQRYFVFRRLLRRPGRKDDGPA